MGQAIPTQHPADVLRPRHTHLRILLAVVTIAVIGLSVAVATLAGDDARGTSATAAADRSGSAGPALVALPPRGTPKTGLRVTTPTLRLSDGGPEEGTRGIVAQAPSARYDGGIVARAPSARYDGGPDEGSRGPGH